MTTWTPRWPTSHNHLRTQLVLQSVSWSVCFIIPPPPSLQPSVTPHRSGTFPAFTSAPASICALQQGQAAGVGQTGRGCAVGGGRAGQPLAPSVSVTRLSHHHSSIGLIDQQTGRERELAAASPFPFQLLNASRLHAWGGTAVCGQRMCPPVWSTTSLYCRTLGQLEREMLEHFRGDRS